MRTTRRLSRETRADRVEYEFSYDLTLAIVWTLNKEQHCQSVTLNTHAIQSNQNILIKGCVLIELCTTAHQ
jgi:hypothetical protein